jgi:hypothetical protein
MTVEREPRIDQDPRGWFMRTFRFTWASVPGHIAFILATAYLYYIDDDFCVYTGVTYAIYLVGMTTREVIAFRERA